MRLEAGVRVSKENAESLNSNLLAKNLQLVPRSFRCYWTSTHRHKKVITQTRAHRSDPGWVWHNARGETCLCPEVSCCKLTPCSTFLLHLLCVSTCRAERPRPRPHQAHNSGTFKLTNALIHTQLGKNTHNTQTTLRAHSQNPYS